MGHKRRNRGQKQTKKQSLYCGLCPYSADDEADLESHRRTMKHKFNYCLGLLDKHRYRLTKDRHGAQIDYKISEVKYEYQNGFIADKAVPPVEFDRHEGKIKTLITTNVSEIKFDLIVKNTCDREILVRDAYLLHPFEVFNITDKEGLAEGKVELRIHPGNYYNVHVSFKNTGIGLYGIPVQFELTSKKRPKGGKDSSETEPKPFNIIRYLEIDVRDPEICPSQELTQERSPFRGETWENILHTVEATTPKGAPLRREVEYIVDYDHALLFYHWPGPWKNMTSEQSHMLIKFTQIIMDGYGSLKKNYFNLMHDLLYLEEYDSMKNIEAYDMAEVQLELFQQIGLPQFKLQVPGLAEKRPSLVKGDKAYVRVRINDVESENTEFESVITAIRENTVILSNFAKPFMEKFNAAKSANLSFDVRFAFNRYPLVVMHRAVDYCDTAGLLDTVLFPQRPEKPFSLFLKNKLDKISLYNTQLNDDPSQYQAVLSILQGTSRPAPYIIYGPPGTGKTATLVEAILQVKKMLPGSFCLVAAPSNAACDNVAQRLAPHCSTKELLRLHSNTRDWDSVPADLQNYSNRTEDMYYFPSPKDVFKYRIVVVTLTYCGRLVERCALKKRNQHFTHVFVDECGQAREPETLVAIGGVVGPPLFQRLGGQIILAGDPQQLGPICTSHRAECLYATLCKDDDDDETQDNLDKHFGLGVSLMERLMKTCELYQKPFDSNYITQLVYNYRSHPDILELPNDLYYDGKLQVKCPDSILQDPILTTCFNGKKNTGRAVVFHGLIGVEQREGQSPSHFNRHEVIQVLKYIDRLIGPKANIELKESEIGIIAPYIRQVYKIKAELRSRGLNDIEVGTTETFQGREKRVMIISTVRSNPNLLDYDRKYQLGFLVNPKRLNVAITRAQSLLIVIGNPMLLSKDSQWRELVEYTINLGSYYGCPYLPRDDELISTVTHRITKLKIADEE